MVEPQESGGRGGRGLCIAMVALAVAVSVGAAAHVAGAGPVSAASGPIETVTVTYPLSGDTVDGAGFRVGGTATEAGGAAPSQVTVNGTVAAVTPGGQWSAVVTLPSGSGTVSVSAEYPDGQTAAASVPVTVIYTPPGGGAHPSPTMTTSTTTSTGSSVTTTTTSTTGVAAICVVPRIPAGTGEQSAERELRLAHCRVGSVELRPSATVKKGHVIETSPKAGRRLGPDASVGLVVSRGRRRR
jgi:hypothetical protein